MNSKLTVVNNTARSFVVSLRGGIGRVNEVGDRMSKRVRVTKPA